MAGGANQPILAVIAFLVIISILFIRKIVSKKVAFKNENKMYVNIQTDQEDLEAIAKLLTDTLPYVELKRMDTLEKGLDLTFVCKSNSIAQIALVKDKITAISANTRLSIIDQPELIV